MFIFFNLVLGLNFLSFVLSGTPSDKKVLVEDANIVACEKNYCHLVQTFKTNENNTYDCHEESIHILFDIKINNVTVNTFGYISEQSRGFIEKNRFFSNDCRKIRKY